MPFNTGVAPICNAKAEQPDFQTVPPRIPPFTVPSGDDINSIIQAINQLQFLLRQLLTPVPKNNIPTIVDFFNFNNGHGGGGGGGGGFGKKSPKQQPTPNSWTEKTRVTQNVRVVNPDDDSQFIIVKETVSITVENKVLGQEITLNLVN